MTTFDHGGAPATNPCGACPYRKDSPSGMWAASEYDKLPAYDEEQSIAPAFFCHEQTGRLCAGWVGCHDMDNSLGLRLAASFGQITVEGLTAARTYESPVPLWESGQAAAEHGKREIDAPDTKASRAVDRMIRRHGVVRVDADKGEILLGRKEHHQ